MGKPNKVSYEKYINANNIEKNVLKDLVKEFNNMVDEVEQLKKQPKPILIIKLPIYADVGNIVLTKKSLQNTLSKDDYYTLVVIGGSEQIQFELLSVSNVETSDIEALQNKIDEALQPKQEY